MYVYNWITLLYLWTWHNIGNQLYFNIKKLKGWGGLFLKNYITFLKLWNYVVSMASHSSTFAWKIPRMEEPGRLQSMGSLRIGHNWATSLPLSCIGEGSSNPLQCSCLENPRGGGAWWAAVYGVAHDWSRTRLKWRSSSSSSQYSNSSIPYVL